MNDNSPQADIVEKKEEVVDSDQTTKEKYIEERKLDEQKCTEEFAQLLQKYNCYTDLQITIGPEGVRGAMVIIKAKL